MLYIYNIYTRKIYRRKQYLCGIYITFMPGRYIEENNIYAVYIYNIYARKIYIRMTDGH